jgi:O-antigen ligase
MLVAVPQSALDRLATISDAFGGNRGANTEAMDSLNERRGLVRDAFQMALDHPLLGVGPGEFQDYRVQKMRNPDGSAKHFIPSHNTFLEIAADEGFVGLLFYLTFLGGIYITLRKTRKLAASRTGPDWDMVSSILVCLEAAFIYFTLCAAFMTCDQHPQQFVLGGMAIALERVVRAAVQLPQQTAATVPEMAIPVLRRRPTLAR